MSDKKKALRRLSSAFKACEQSGLIFIGMDNMLLSYDKKEFNEAYDEIGNTYDTQVKLGQGDRVNTHGTYIESGGW